MEWDNLACVLINMGFPAIWINQVMKCVTSVTYSFMINGNVYDVVV